MSGGADARTGADVAGCLWPLDRRDELTALVAGAAGIGVLGPAERFEWSYADVAPALSPRALAAAPAVVRVGAGAGALLGVIGHVPGGVRVIGRDGAPVICDAGALGAHLRGPAEATARAGIDATVARADVAPARRPAVVDALLRVSLGAERIAEGERLRPARPSMWAALREAGIRRRVGVAVAGYLAQLALVAGLWWVVGARAVAADAGSGGSVGSVGAIAAVATIIAALVAVRLASSWIAGRLAIEVGNVLRDRLLHGLLALDSESIRAEGIGQLLGRVVETEALESLALGGGLMAAAGAFELATGAVVLAVGIAAAWQLPLLGAALALAAIVGAGVQRTLARWSGQRVELTHDLVERMVGQRTLVAQQPASLRHVEQDAALAHYRWTGRALDRVVALLAIAIPRGWLIAAVVALAPWLPDAGAHPGAFATSLGGTLLVYGALRKLAQAFPALGSAAIAWRQVAGMFAAARRAAAPPPLPPPATAGAAGAATSAGGSPDAPLISARDLGFRYPGRAEPVLSGCALEIRRGDRVLLEGPSGGGKSTLGALLVGLRVPDVVGGGGWWRRRSSTRTTCSRQASCSTCCSAAPGRRAAKTSPRPKRSRASWISVRSWRVCPRGWNSWWATAAGSCHTASAAACSSPAPCFNPSTPGSSTRASPPSIPRPWNGRWPAC